jgi:hypothetical protein
MALIAQQLASAFLPTMPRLLITHLTPKGKIKHKGGEPLTFSVDYAVGIHELDMPPVLSGLQVEIEDDDGTSTCLRVYKQEELVGTGVSDHPTFSLVYEPVGRRKQNRKVTAIVVLDQAEAKPEPKAQHNPIEEKLKRIEELVEEVRQLIQA